MFKSVQQFYIRRRYNSTDGYELFLQETIKDDATFVKD